MRGSTVPQVITFLYTLNKWKKVVQPRALRLCGRGWKGGKMAIFNMFFQIPQQIIHQHIIVNDLNLCATVMDYRDIELKKTVIFSFHLQMYLISLKNYKLSF